MAISIEVMLEMMTWFEEDYHQVKEEGRPTQKIVEAATFAVLAYCASLRG
jgi:hypothetical protein